MERLIGVSEAAGFLRVSIPTMRAWTYQRRIPVVKLGRRSLYRPSDLESFVEKNIQPIRETKKNAGT